MKKFYFIMMMSSILFTGCNNASFQMDTKKNNNLVEVDVSKLGVENIKGEKEIHTVYDANDDKEKKYAQLKKLEKENKIDKEKVFKAFIREEGKK